MRIETLHGSMPGKTVKVLKVRKKKIKNLSWVIKILDEGNKKFYMSNKKVKLN